MEVTAPATIDDLAATVRDAARAGSTLRPKGSGHEWMLGYPVEPDVVVDTRTLRWVRDFDPDELVVRVGAGLPVADLHATLAAHNLRAVVPSDPPDRTIGGVIAAGSSGYARFRHGPVRDHVIGVTVVSGAGDVVRAGGQVVKNVTGFDLSRLCAGSLGRLGIIAEIGLRVFPVRGEPAYLSVDDAGAAWRSPVRPVAVIETREGACAVIEDAPEAVAAQARRLGARPAATDSLPSPADWAWRATVRSRPARQSELLDGLPSSWRFIAQHGVGLTTVGGDVFEVEAAAHYRDLVEATGGRFVLHRIPEELRNRIDPWGEPPADLEIQRRIVAAFDPHGIFNPGILPGGL